MKKMDSKLNDDLTLSIKGGSLLIVIGTILNKIVQLEMAAIAAEKEQKSSDHIHHSIDVMDAIGEELYAVALSAFGQDYMAKVFNFKDNHKHTAPPKGATIN